MLRTVLEGRTSSSSSSEDATSLQVEHHPRPPLPRVNAAPPSASSASAPSSSWVRRVAAEAKARAVRRRRTNCKQNPERRRPCGISFDTSSDCNDSLPSSSESEYSAKEKEEGCKSKLGSLEFGFGRGVIAFDTSSSEDERGDDSGREEDPTPGAFHGHSEALSSSTSFLLPRGGLPGGGGFVADFEADEDGKAAPALETRGATAAAFTAAVISPSETPPVEEADRPVYSAAATAATATATETASKIATTSEEASASVEEPEDRDARQPQRRPAKRGLSVFPSVGNRRSDDAEPSMQDVSNADDASSVAMRPAGWLQGFLQRGGPSSSFSSSSTSSSSEDEGGDIDDGVVANGASLKAVHASSSFEGENGGSRDDNDAVPAAASLLRKISGGPAAREAAMVEKSVCAVASRTAANRTTINERPFSVEEEAAPARFREAEARSDDAAVRPEEDEAVEGEADGDRIPPPHASNISSVRGSVRGSDNSDNNSIHVRSAAGNSATPPPPEQGPSHAQSTGGGPRRCGVDDENGGGRQKSPSFTLRMEPATAGATRSLRATSSWGARPAGWLEGLLQSSSPSDAEETSDETFRGARREGKSEKSCANRASCPNSPSEDDASVARSNSGRSEEEYNDANGNGRSHHNGEYSSSSEPDDRTSDVSEEDDDDNDSDYVDESPPTRRAAATQPSANPTSLPAPPRMGTATERQCPLRSDAAPERENLRQSTTKREEEVDDPRQAPPDGSSTADGTTHPDLPPTEERQQGTLPASSSPVETNVAPHRFLPDETVMVTDGVKNNKYPATFLRYLSNENSDICEQQQRQQQQGSVPVLIRWNVCRTKKKVDVSRVFPLYEANGDDQVVGGSVVKDEDNGEATVKCEDNVCGMAIARRSPRARTKTNFFHASDYCKPKGKKMKRVKTEVKKESGGKKRERRLGASSLSRTGDEENRDEDPYLSDYTVNYAPPSIDPIFGVHFHVDGEQELSKQLKAADATSWGRIESDESECSSIVEEDLDPGLFPPAATKAVAEKTIGQVEKSEQVEALATHPLISRRDSLAAENCDRTLSSDLVAGEMHDVESIFTSEDEEEDDIMSFGPFSRSNRNEKEDEVDNTRNVSAETDAPAMGSVGLTCNESAIAIPSARQSTIDDESANQGDTGREQQRPVALRPGTV